MTRNDIEVGDRLHFVYSTRRFDLNLPGEVVTWWVGGPRTVIGLGHQRAVLAIPRHAGRLGDLVFVDFVDLFRTEEEAAAEGTRRSKPIQEEGHVPG